MANETIPTIELEFTRLPEMEMASRARQFGEHMIKRRTVRDFSDRPVPRPIIEECLRTATSAPSGANRQPWHFAVVESADLKKKIRQGAEREEREFYERRATDEWLRALAPLGTDAEKPFLEIAAYLIVIFGQKYLVDDAGNKHKNYYVTESVSIATGLLIAALHHAGLATLTHTPSPMRFLNEILGRPVSEKPLMILIAGYPADNARVPDIHRKSLREVCSFL